MSSTQLLEPQTLKRANDAFGDKIIPPSPLFDEFWHEGELALLFGHHGVGKGVMALAIADALARGRPIHGLEMPTKRRRVLYVDLVRSDVQFGCRYSCGGRKARREYKFSRDLYRDRPPSGEDIVEWLRHAVEENAVRVIVIDSLSAIARTNDGTRETLAMVRSLRQMTIEFGISVLVLTDSHPYVFGREITERDLRRTRVLCDQADSVFAMAAVGETDMRYVMQTRSQAGELVWTRRSPARIKLNGVDHSSLGVEFVAPTLSTEQRELICQIKHLSDEKWTIRSIADKLEMSKSTAQRLLAKWTPELEPQVQPTPVKPSYSIDKRPDGWDEAAERQFQEQLRAERHLIPWWLETPQEIAEYKEQNPDWREEAESWPENNVEKDEDGYDLEGSEEDRYGDENEYRRKSSPVVEEPAAPPRPQYAAALARRSILDLEHGLDHNDKKIFIESRDKRTGKPKVWYERHSRRNSYTRWERGTYGISGSDFGPSPFYPRETPIAWPRSWRSPPRE